MKTRSVISRRFLNLLVAVIALATMASTFISHSTQAQQRGSFSPTREGQREPDPQPQTALAGNRSAILTATGSSDRAVVFPDALTPATQTLVSALPANASPHGTDFFGSDNALVADFGHNQIFVVQVSTATLQATINTSASPAYNGTGTVAVSPLLSAALAMGDTNTTLHIIQAPFNASSPRTQLTLPGSILAFQTQAIVFNQAGRAFVYHTTGISVINSPYNAIAFTIPVSNGGSGAIAISPDGNTLLVTDEATANVRIFQAPFSASSTPASLPIPGGNRLDGIVVAPNGQTAIGVSGFAHQAFAISAPFSSTSTVANIPLPAGDNNGFEDVSISADSQVAIITGGTNANAAVAVQIQAPFGASSTTTLLPISNVANPGRGFGSVRFIPPALAPPPTGSCVAPPSGMVAWYPGDGNGLDLQGGDSATRTGSNPTFAAGKVAQAFQFTSSSNGYLEVPDAPAFDSIVTGVTLDAWINPTVGNGFTPIVFKGNGSTGGNQPYSLFVNSNGTTYTINFRAGNTSTFDALNSVTQLPLNAYTHVAATYDGTTMRIYINGNLDASQTTNIGTLANDNLPLQIGNGYLGAIDELEIFNRALAQSEIQAIVAADSFGKCKPSVPTPTPATSCVVAPSGMTAWYPGDGNTNDIQGGNNGTVMGSGVSFAAGKVAQAFQFNGGGLVQANDAPALHAINAVTLDAWINPTGSQGFSTIVFKGNGSTPGNQPYSLLFSGGDTRITFRVGNTSTFDALGSFSQVPLNAYTHVAATYDGTRMRLYINGTLDAVKTTNIGTLAIENNPLRIGDTYIGAIDELEIFNVALPQSEIQRIVAAGSFGKCAPVTPSTGDVLISEFRLQGPAGAQDEFIELYNNSNSPVNVNVQDNSGGWALVSSDGITRAVVPVGAFIPSHGHYLVANNGSGGYSLTAAADATYATDIPNNSGLAFFRTANGATLNAANALDAVGFSGNSALYFETTPLTPITPTNEEYSFTRHINDLTGRVQDTGNNAADFVLVSTTANVGGTAVALGAPGPENMNSPLARTRDQFPGAHLDPSQCEGCAPNRVRNTAPFTFGSVSFPNGTLSIRRTYTNLTGAAITRLRFRIVDITTLNNTAGLGAPVADLRAVTSTDTTVTIMGSPINVRGTTLEEPPNQSTCANCGGGGLNSTLAAGTISTGAPLANGGTITIQYLLGVKAGGRFRFFVAIEAAP